jgi:hypothetical protein
MLLFLLGCVTWTAVAQEPRSAALAKELATLLDQAKLDAIAAKEPSQTDAYVAALYFNGSQLLVASARYSVPVLLNEALAKRNYRDIYIDLNSASIEGSKVFIVDLGADGLKARRAEGEPYDTYETAKTRLAFDGEWKAQKLTEEQYMKAFSEADDAYARMLAILIAQLKKG